MSDSKSKDPFTVSKEEFTKLRNEKPTAEDVKNIFEKDRPKNNDEKSNEEKKKIAVQREAGL